MVTTGNGTMDSGDTGGTPEQAATSVRRRRLRGGLVTIGTVGALVAAMGLTVLGLGSSDNAVADYDASAWLWSTARSEMARVNGITGRVDTRVRVPQARSHSMQVVQTDRLLVLRDLNTGQLSSLDLATLQITATSRTTAGLGVNVALHEDAAFVVDAVQGIVRQLDPATLTPVGEPIHFPPGITGGEFDGEGRLWIAAPGQGTVSAITAGALPASTDGGSGGATGPQQVRTVAVAEPSHDLVISTLDSGVAVLDRTTSTLTTVRDGDPKTTPLTLGGPGSLPPHTSGGTVPVTVSDSRHVVVVGDNGVREFDVPGQGSRLSPAVAWSGRFYCADEDSGTLFSFDSDGKLVGRIDVKGANGPLELEVRENHLFVNAPNSATARVVDDKHRVRVVNKYANNILGGDPPPIPPPPPPPKKPVIGKPGAPRSVTAAAGDARARVSWRPAPANGATVTRYVVRVEERTFEVGANQRSIEVTELTNGKTYRFSVHAVNAKGAGPDRLSNPVVPTAEVPDPPASVTAQERPDGTVLVKWPAADGQGNKISKYVVTAVSAGASAPAGESTRTELVVPAGELEYGNQYAFTVVAVNSRGAGSKASPISNSVVPFTLPGAPRSLTARTVAGEAGAVTVAWAPAQENGRPVTKYLVDANGQRSEVTDTATKLTGLGDGQVVTVKVKAVNEAGPGPEATETARTVAVPRVTVTGSSADATSVTIAFTVDDGGGQATCQVAVAGKAPVAGNCSSIRVGGLTAGTAYTFTVSARNAAGTGTATRAQPTDPRYGIATCENGPSGDQRTYCDADVDGRNGNEIFSAPRQLNNQQVGWARPGTRLRTYCKKQGENVDSWIYNNQKQSSWWVQVDYQGRNYIPWAWLNLEGGDDLGDLPAC